MRRWVGGWEKPLRTAPRSGVMLMVAVSPSTLNKISTALRREVLPRVPGTSMPSRTTKRVPRRGRWVGGWVGGT